MNDSPNTRGRIELTLGGLSFCGEGEQDWLREQLDKLLAAAPSLTQLKAVSQPSANSSPEEATAGSTGVSENFTDPLARYIKAKEGESNQTKRFLATADWLRRRGTSELTTSAVSKALAEHHQKRLSNPADCLIKNVSKGFCEKTKDGFFITPDGLKELGHG